MKRFFAILFLASIIVIGSSFKYNHLARTEHFKNDGSLIAVVDGKTFELRDDNKYSAVLANKATSTFPVASAGAKLTRVATVINFYGNEFADCDGALSAESLSLEYAFNEGSLGAPPDQKLVLNYNNQKYYNVTSETVITITKLEWSADRRYFVISADFDCKMRRWGASSASQPTVKVKGRMVNINVEVPSWIVIKNPAQTAAGE